MRTADLTRGIALVALGLLGSLCLLALRPGQIEASDSEPTVGNARVAVLLDLVGAQATLGQPAMNGFLLALQERARANESPLYTALFDTRSDTKTTEAAARKASLASVAAAGFTDNDSVREAGPILAQAGLPFLSIGATDPALPADIGRTVFLTPFGDNAQAAAAAEFARQRFGKTVAVLWDSSSSYTRTLPQYFRTRFAQLGGLVMVDESFAGGCDIRRLGDKVASLPAKPDLVFLAALPECPGDLVASLRQAGLTQPIIGGDGLDTPNLLGSGKSMTTNVWYTTHAWLSAETGSKETRSFIDAYTAAYGIAPTDAFSALGYDAAGLLIDAIRRTQNQRPHEIIAALERTTDFKGVTGNISFSKDDHVPKKTVWLIVVSKGKTALETAFAPQVIPPPITQPAAASENPTP